MENHMLRIAVIDDDPHDSERFVKWILSTTPEARVDAWRTRQEAVAAVQRERYDLITVDLDMDKDRHAGIAVIDANTASHKAPVLVSYPQRKIRLSTRALRRPRAHGTIWKSLFQKQSSSRRS